MNNPTSYGYEVNHRNSPILYFRLHDKNYIIDYSKYIELRLNIKFKYKARLDVELLNRSNLRVINDEQLLEWRIPSMYLSELESLEITPVVKLTSGTYNVKPFKLVIFRTMDSNSNAILNAIEYFNKTYAKYLNTIKRVDIGQPDGVVPLDNEGRINKRYMPFGLASHAELRIYDTIYTVDDIHGLRINRKNFDFEYFDEDDQEWYAANSIHGGRFGYPNKPSPYFDVHGGFFQLIQGEDIDGGNLGDGLVDAYDGGNFTDNITSIVHGGRF